MRYNKLGDSGLLVSEMSFGCMMFQEDTEEGHAHAYDMLKCAYSHGCNFFDNAEVYGDKGTSEIVMGHAVQQGLQDGVWERCDLVISTKLMWGGRGGRDTMNSIGLTRKHLVEGIHSSLARMQLDHVDLCVLQPPSPAPQFREQEFHFMRAGSSATAQTPSPRSGRLSVR